MIRDASHDVVEHRNPYVTCVEGSIGVFTQTQEPRQPLDDYLTRFKAQVDQVKAQQTAITYPRINSVWNPGSPARPVIRMAAPAKPAMAPARWNHRNRSPGKKVENRTMSRGQM